MHNREISLLKENINNISDQWQTNMWAESNFSDIFVCLCANSHIQTAQIKGAELAPRSRWLSCLESYELKFCSYIPWSNSAEI